MNSAMMQVATSETARGVARTRNTQTVTLVGPRQDMNNALSPSYSTAGGAYNRSFAYLNPNSFAKVTRNTTEGQAATRREVQNGSS